MKSYLIKNKKYSFMILLFIVSFFFVLNVKALTYKDLIRTTYQQTEKNGFFLTGNTSASGIPAIGEMVEEFKLTSNSPVYQVDYILFRFNTMNFALISQDNYYCNNLTADYSNGTLTGFHCGTANSTSSVHDYDLKINGWINYADGTASACYMSSEFENHLICPYERKSIMSFSIRMTSTYRRTEYRLNVAPAYYLYNADSTEIVNALSNLGTIQQNTTTTIQNFNNYVSDTSTTQAQTNQTTALGGMNTQFSSHLSQMNELTQLTMLPITFINNLLNNTCQPLVWDIPFVNSRVVVPCMSTIYNGYFSTFVSVFSLIMTSLLGYRAFIKLFNAIKGLVDAEDDKLEVVDL